MSKHHSFPIAAPPFPWAGAEEAARQFGPLLVRTEERLRQACQATQGHPSAWAFSAIPWLRPLIKAASVEAGGMRRFSIVDRPAIRAHLVLIDSLIAAMPAALTEQRQVVMNSKTLFRTAPVYSRRSGGAINVQFYAHTVIGFELQVLLQQFPRNAPISLLHIMGMFAHFTAIHPFEDGNGRAARYLMSQLLRQSGMWGALPLPLAMLHNRDRFNAVSILNAFTLGKNWGVFVPYMCQWINASVELSVLATYADTAARGELPGALVNLAGMEFSCPE